MRLSLEQRARATVNNHVRRGTLKRKPCEACGTRRNVHAHHDDYSKPLKVRWLCAHDHALEHMKSGNSQYNMIANWTKWEKCPRCGGAEKLPDGTCRECRRDYMEKYYQQNRTKLLDAARRRDAKRAA
jgi:hypothetical protein